VSTSIRYTDDHAVERDGHSYGLTSRVTSASPGKARLSLGVTCLFSFGVSAAATLLVCALTPVPPLVARYTTTAPQGESVSKSGLAPARAVPEAM
jgi:hypothetical protein